MYLITIIKKCVRVTVISQHRHKMREENEH